MSSGITFRNVDCYCSNGMAEYLLDLCISEFSQMREHKQFPHVLEFFSDYREMFFSGMSVIISEEDFESKEDYRFLASLFDQVFECAVGSKSELRDSGKEKIELNFRALITEFDAYASQIT